MVVRERGGGMKKSAILRSIGIRALVDKVIIVLGFTAVALLLVDGISVVPRGYFFLNFTWLSEAGVVLYAIALALYAFRRVFLKPSRKEGCKPLVHSKGVDYPAIDVHLGTGYGMTSKR